MGEDGKENNKLSYQRDDKQQEKKAKRQHKLPKSLRDHDDDNNEKLANLKPQIQKVVREKKMPTGRCGKSGGGSGGGPTSWFRRSVMYKTNKYESVSGLEDGTNEQQVTYQLWR